MLVGDVDAYFFLEIADDGSVKLPLLGGEVSSNTDFYSCEAKVQWLTCELSLLNNDLISGCLQD